MNALPCRLTAIAVLLLPSALLAAEKTASTATSRRAASPRAAVQTAAREARSALRLWIPMGGPFGLVAAPPLRASRRFVITANVWPPTPLRARSSRGFSSWFPSWEGFSAPLLPLLIPAGFAATHASRDASASDEASSPGEADDDGNDEGRDLEWLLRHKVRSVLETERPGWQQEPERQRLERLALERLLPWLPQMVATLEYVTSPTAATATAPSGLAGASLMRLQGQLPMKGRWAVGGLVYQSESPRWRTLTEASFVPLQGHELAAISAWTNRPLRPGLIDSPQTEQAVDGVVVLKDRWQVARPLAVSAGARYSYTGFLDDPHHVDPLGAIEWSPAQDASVRASIRSRTLIPGGGSLSLSLFDPIIPAVDGARLGHSLRYEVLARSDWGATSVSTRAFCENVSDPFVNALVVPLELQARTVTVGRSLSLRGVGASVSQRLGGVMEGTLSYSLALAERDVLGDAEPLLVEQGLLVPEGAYHNFVGRLTTRIDPTDTSFVAFSRFVAAKQGTRFRYEFQVRQVVPFVARRTGTEWTVVVAVRNLLQEPEEDDALEEMAEARPPRRVIGGVSVRF